MEKISYKLEVFEGPLDLLLFLITKNKLNIYDIPVAELLDQYMEHIRQMKEADIEVTSEFLTMASRLVYIKTAMLMPKHEEADELKRELVGELMEYQLAREMAQKLAKQADFDRYSREEMVLEADNSYKIHHDVSVLYEAYIAAAGRKRAEKEAPSKQVFSDIVARPVVSVNSRVVNILRRLYRYKNIDVEDLFMQSQSKSEAVATFLAVLDLLKNNRIILVNDRMIEFNYGGDEHWNRKKSSAQ